MKEQERRNFIKKTGLLLTGIVVNNSLSIGKGLSLQETNDYNILDYGALGDGKTINTFAIQKAIDKCSKHGGGRVVVPRGIFLTGGFMLRNNIEFHLEKDAVILGSPYMKDYHQRELLSGARYGDYLNYALVFSQGVKNVTVSGYGTLNGNAQLGGELKEFKKGFGLERKRPALLWFDECENILVKEITFTNSAMWTETYSRCKNVHVNGITVKENYFYNADGCDIVDCEDFIVENCNINALDDAICLKGFTNKGCIRGIIRNNKVRSICNGIKMGTDSSGGFRDISIENNEVWQTGVSGLELAIADGGILENISVSNIKMNVVGTPIVIVLNHRNRVVWGDLTVPKGIIRNVRIKGIDAVVDKYERLSEKEREIFDYFTPRTSSIHGCLGQYVEDVIIEDINITVKGGFPARTTKDAMREIPDPGSMYPCNKMLGILPACGFFIRHVRGLSMRNIHFSIEKEDERPVFVIDDTHDSKFDDITAKTVTNVPVFAYKDNCTGINLD